MTQSQSQVGGTTQSQFQGGGRRKVNPPHCINTDGPYCDPIERSVLLQTSRNGKTGGIPYHKTPSHTPMGTSPVATQLLRETSATLSEAVKHDFRDLGGTRNMRLIYREEEDLLGWEDPGEAPQHKTEGYMPMVDEETVPWIKSKGTGT
jgi:hypothetical protein